jgi:uncharacterized protein
MPKQYKFFCNEVHCKACEFLLENELSKNPQVSSVHVNVASKEIVVETKKQVDPSKLSQELTDLVKTKGYTISPNKISKKINLEEFGLAVLITTLLVLSFLYLQRLGLADWITGEITYPLAFGIGIVASLSSCMAVVGGLLLSLSATWAKQETRSSLYNHPQIHFHVGRLLGFLVFGLLLGLVGSLFTLNIYVSVALNALVGLVMLILGLNLLELFDFTKKLQFSLPKKFSQNTIGKEISGRLAPFLIGSLTFFLPCGFTQSMQVYSLSTGSPITAGLTMLAFAVGTLPVLALIGFSSFNFSSGKYAGVFFKTAGLLVVIFSIYNLYSALTVLGFLPVLFNF